MSTVIFRDTVRLYDSGSLKMSFITEKPFVQLIPEEDGIVCKAVKTPAGICVPLNVRFIVPRVLVNCYELANRDLTTVYDKDNDTIKIVSPLLHSLSPVFFQHTDYDADDIIPPTATRIMTTKEAHWLNLFSIANKRFRDKEFTVTMVADKKRNFIKLSPAEDGLPTHRDLAQWYNNGYGSYLGTVLKMTLPKGSSKKTFLLPKWWRYAAGVNDDDTLTVKDDGESLWILPPNSRCQLDNRKIVPAVDKGKKVVVCGSCADNKETVADVVEMVKKLINLVEELSSENELLKAELLKRL